MRSKLYNCILGLFCVGNEKRFALDFLQWRCTQCRLSGWRAHPSMKLNLTLSSYFVSVINHSADKTSARHAKKSNAVLKAVTGKIHKNLPFLFCSSVDLIDIWLLFLLSINVVSVTFKTQKTLRRNSWRNSYCDYIEIFLMPTLKLIRRHLKWIYLFFSWETKNKDT